jgi:hypothetical protein
MNLKNEPLILSTLKCLEVETKCLLDYQRKAEELKKAIESEMAKEGHCYQSVKEKVITTRNINPYISNINFLSSLKNLFTIFEDVVREWRVNSAFNDGTSIKKYFKLLNDENFRIINYLGLCGFQTQNGSYIDDPELEELQKNSNSEFWLQGLLVKHKLLLNKSIGIYQISFAFCYILRENICYLEKLRDSKINKSTVNEETVTESANSTLNSILLNDNGNTFKTCLSLFKYMDLVDDEGRSILGKKMSGKLVAAMVAIQKARLLNSEKKYTLSHLYPYFQKYFGTKYTGDPEDSLNTQKYKNAYKLAQEYFESINVSV